MRYIFYHYNDFGTLVFDYYDEETHVTQSYVVYTLKQAICKFRTKGTVEKSWKQKIENDRKNRK